MTERVDAYLDGMTDASSLSPSDYEDARIAKAAIDAARVFLAERSAPDVTSDVMRRIEALGNPQVKSRTASFGRLAASLWSPRRVELQWRPAYALVAATAILIAVFLAQQGQRPEPTDRRMFVQFRLSAEDAMDVRLAGSFTNWEPRYELHQSQPGLWTITLPLAPGIHDYMFIVDGQRWIPDPAAEHVDDGFGGVNSRIAVVPPDPPRL